jgi:GNAT superfamily N-acetyltransferase
LIRECREGDVALVYTIINEAAEVYQGVIPVDRWKEPYMPKSELQHEISEGVIFWGYEENGRLLGVMGIQPVKDVTLIRHAYVRPAHQNRGIGGKLLSALRQKTTSPLLVGTWADALWAIRFYEKHGFRLVTPQQKDRLLRRYWSIPERQIDTSVVLGDQGWFESQSGEGEKSK